MSLYGPWMSGICLLATISLHSSNLNSFTIGYPGDYIFALFKDEQSLKYRVIAYTFVLSFHFVEVSVVSWDRC